MTLLIVSFMILMTFETIWNNDSVYKIHFFIFEAFISIIFALEYVYRFLRSKNKIKFPLTFIAIVDLLSFLPFFLWFFVVWDYLKLLRLLKVFRILRLLRKIPITVSFLKSIKEYENEYKAVSILSVVLLFIWTSFVYYFEKNSSWTLFTSLPVTLWWWLVTMTTVWYWDMFPLTSMWRVFWSILIILWPLVLAIVSAITTMVFMETLKNQEYAHRHIRWRICHRCKSRNIKEANYCMECWEELVSVHNRI